MAIPERLPDEPDVKEWAEEADPLKIERKDVAIPTLQNFPHQVYMSPGQPVIQTPQNMPVQITLPAREAKIELMSRGSTDDSGTWLGTFWQRIIMMARYAGKKIVEPRES